MIDLKEFNFQPHRAGFQAIGLFSNGFGVSVIPEADQQHYEVAVLEHENENRSHVCYTSGLTFDVFRNLTVEEVHAVVDKVRDLIEGTRVLPPDPFDEVY